MSADAQGIIFVLDSADDQRFELAKRYMGGFLQDLGHSELHGMLENAQLENASLLVLLNKQDLDEAASLEELEQRLEVKSRCVNRRFHVQPTIATTGKGLNEGLHWLCANMDEIT